MKKIFTTDLLSEEGMKLFLGKTLRLGTIVSCAITLLGGIIYLFHSHHITPDYSPENFKGAAGYLREFSGIIPRILEADGAAIIQLGVIVLIATPIVRILFSVVAFLLEKDYLYVGITLLVLGIIIANMVLGLH
jgi:uncharacterized membrane protein